MPPHSDIVLFDTETTGLIDNIAIPLKDQPRIIELFALKLAKNAFGELIEIGTWYSRFKVKKIEEDAVKTHGITVEMLRNEPHFAERYLDLADFFLGCRYMVGHNLSFDLEQLHLELRRMGKERAFPFPPIHIDTVEVTEGEEGFRLGLDKLHERLFGEGFPEAHAAEADTRALARCFIELVRTGAVSL